MKILTIVRLLFIFYKNFLLASLLITACSIEIFLLNGLKSFAALFGVKIFSFGQKT